MKNFYVYGHYKKDTDELFYIGKGIRNRKDSVKDRNKFWKNTVAKHGFYSKILVGNLDEAEAFKLEEDLIIQHGRRDLGTGILVNLTNGGEGSTGLIQSEECKEALRLINNVKVVQLSLDKQFIEEYESAKVAQGKLGLCNIIQCCRGALKSCGGFLWMYKSDYLLMVEGKSGWWDDYSAISDNLRSVVKLDLYTLEYLCRYSSALDASRDVKSSKIGSVCRRERKSAGGYFWMFESDYLEISQEENWKDKFKYTNLSDSSKFVSVYCIDTKTIFQSVKEAQQVCKVTNVQSACSQNSKLPFPKNRRGGLVFIYLRDKEKFNL